MRTPDVAIGHCGVTGAPLSDRISGHAHRDEHVICFARDPSTRDLAHEIAHLATGCEGHTPAWAQAMRMMGHEPDQPIVGGPTRYHRVR